MTSIISDASNFETQYKDWLGKFKTSSSWSQCVQQNCLVNAENKYYDLSKKSSDYSSPDLKHPVMIVYLYTIAYPRIHDIVNSWLDTTNKEDDSWMSVFSVLLQLAMDRLSIIVRKNCKSTLPVYRGQYCQYDMKLAVGDKSRFLRFVSTSYNPEVALGFGGYCPMVIEMINATKGLPLGLFSQFPGEEEVLIKPGTQFIVTQYLTDQGQIKAAWENKVQKKNTQLPKTFYQIEMIDGTKRKRRGSVSAELKNVPKEFDGQLERQSLMVRRRRDVPFDDYKEWKEFLRKSHDGVDSDWYPKCLPSTVSVSTAYRAVLAPQLWAFTASLYVAGVF